eukprot:Hpha_TRINITY_DN2185_c0_g1::TRINITY_DN2185_c0_g1_i1::g.42224::m.42224
MSEGQEFSSGLRHKLAQCSLRPVREVREREEKDHQQFSPTHFSVDLFAPHATTEQVVGDIETPGTPEVDDYRKHSIDSGGSSSPRGQAAQMLSMMEALKQLNKPGNETLTEDEWGELGMTWSVPIAGARTDIVPGGHAVMVPLRDKDAYCDMAIDALRTCIRQAEMYA